MSQGVVYEFRDQSKFLVVGIINQTDSDTIIFKLRRMFL